MAKTQKMFLTLAVLLALAIPYATADAYEKQAPAPESPQPYSETRITSDVVVEGVVYCQSCNYSGTWSLTEAVPIAEAKISVICRNYKHRVNYYNTFTTSEGGYFYAKLEKYSLKHELLDHPLQACHVKLVSSPDEKCNVFTNVNYGVNGTPLRYDSKRITTKNYEAVIYAAGPLAFRPDHCAPKQY